MTALGKFLLFFSSWAPAYLVIGLIASDADDSSISHICFGMAVVSVAVYFWMEALIFRRAARSLVVKSLSKRDENILNYVIAYLPPFFSVDVTKNGQLYAIVLFYVLFSITYVSLNLYYLNPMFVFRSYKTYTLI
jgi:hypothetical protein